MQRCPFRVDMVNHQPRGLERISLEGELTTKGLLNALSQVFSQFGRSLHRKRFSQHSEGTRSDGIESDGHRLLAHPLRRGCRCGQIGDALTQSTFGDDVREQHQDAADVDAGP